MTLNKYQLLPFQFKRFENHALVTNQAGEFCFLSLESFDKLTQNKLETSDSNYTKLKGRHFLTDTQVAPVVNLLATKYRTKKSFLAQPSSLHMVVTTLRCNHKCRYCHASCTDMTDINFDMTIVTARKCVETILEHPSRHIKIEFQGGESLLNFKVVKEIVEYSKKLNKKKGKSLEYVICTNLTLLDKNTALYLKKNNVFLSVSLDGPQTIHDACRKMRNNQSSYDNFTDKLQLARQIYQNDGVDALMTTTSYSLNHLKEVIDEYVKLGFRGVFIRALNPFGFAVQEKENLGCDTGLFLQNYKSALEYIIGINLRGLHFTEHYTSMLLNRILTPFSDGFMDLQFPSGAGLCGVIYDYDGSVYPCDEARMLARNGDKSFCMGSVNSNNGIDVFNGEIVKKLTNHTCAEVMPACSGCVYQMYCGADPVRNYVLHGDVVGQRSLSDFCQKQTTIFDHLFELIRQNDPEIMRVFWSWITRRNIKDIIKCENL